LNANVDYLLIEHQGSQGDHFLHDSLHGSVEVKLAKELKIPVINGLKKLASDVLASKANA